MSIINTPLIYENILVHLPVKDLMSAKDAFEHWSESVSRPEFWFRKAAKDGMSKAAMDQWKEFLHLCEYAFMELLQGALQYNEVNGFFPSIMFMVLTQDKIEDIEKGLTYFAFDFSTLQGEFKLLTHFENYYLSSPDPILSGIEIEVCPDLRLEFVLMSDGDVKLWSRQKLVRGNGEHIVKLWNNSAPTLVATVNPNEKISVINE